MACSTSADSGNLLYWTDDFPTQTARVFSVDVVSKPNYREGNGTFSPDGQAFFFTEMDFFKNISIQYMHLDGRKWSNPAPAPFAQEGDNWEAFPAPNGQYLLFISNRPPATNRGQSKPWIVRKNPNNHWGTPELLDLPLQEGDLFSHPTVSQNNHLFFSGQLRGHDHYGHKDIYHGQLFGDTLNIQNLGSTINTFSDELQPFIAPDESYLLFSSDREGGRGNYDVYISYATEAGWGDPINLGPSINTAGSEYAARITPDHRFVLFDRAAGPDQDLLGSGECNTRLADQIRGGVCSTKKHVVEGQIRSNLSLDTN